jgi:hypothetical protein
MAKKEYVRSQKHGKLLNELYEFGLAATKIPDRLLGLGAYYCGGDTAQQHRTSSSSLSSSSSSSSLVFIGNWELDHSII